MITTIIASALVAGACGDDNDDDDPSPTAGSTSAATSTSGGATGDIMVFAAASLTDAFEDIGRAFKAANGDASVTFNFAGSPTLRTQLQEGADADIYASADTNNMQQALEAGLVVDGRQTFTRNRLVVILPADNPASVTALQDLGQDGLKLVLAAEDVPVGHYAREAIARMQASGSFGETFEADVLENIVSNEPNVKAVVTKVQLGEADAGIVYVTDITAGLEAEVTAIDIPDDLNVIADYPIAVTAGAKNLSTAAAFIDFVLSDDGQAILAEYGFQPID